ncbi:hypothetical protein R1flu_003136 [Riccia fluitans]|uniref:ATP-grasp domain-containing protein n=1 Tax=Riccia fluitans TaxID=41844 RepID=A0ABD1Y873_9MARC
MPMSRSQFKWSRGKLTEGFSSMAQHLGMKPDEVVFIHSLVVNPKGRSWRLKYFSSDSLTSSYVGCMSGPSSTVMHFPMSKSQQQYWDKYFKNGGQLIPVQRKGNTLSYPDTSLIEALLDNCISTREFELLAGKVIANSFVTDEVEELAKKVGGRTLMSCEEFLHFCGKDYLHKVADQIGIAVPPGIVVQGHTTSSTIIDFFRQKLENDGIDPAHTKVWIKPSSLSGGRGIIRPNGSTESLSEGLLQLAKVFHQAGFYTEAVKEESQLSIDDPFEGMLKFMPIILEADVAELPCVRRKVDDVAVNAVSGQNGVVHVETTPFHAENGIYTGSRLPTPEDDTLVEVAEVSVDRLLNWMWGEGYRGYVGVDTVVVEKTNGQLVAYVTDLNTRLCGATPLIVMAHRFEARLGYRPCVFSETFRLRIPEDTIDPFDVVEKSLGNLLYRGSESGYAGIAPIIVHIHPDTDFIQFRAIAIGRDELHLNILALALESLEKYE